jgi:hypothetical protein
MASAWIYQDDKQVKKHGADQASWYVGWIDPEGKRRCKSCGPGEQGRRNAEKLRRKREAQLLTGTYENESKAVWADFRKEWEAQIGALMEPGTRALTIDALNHFERLVRPVRTHFLTSKHIDRYVSLRRLERGRRRGSTVSVATINKELRHIRAVLRVAKDWGYMSEVPRFRMQREPGQLPNYVTGSSGVARSWARAAFSAPSGSLVRAFLRCCVRSSVRPLVRCGEGAFARSLVRWCVRACVGRTRGFGVPGRAGRACRHGRGHLGFQFLQACQRVTRHP